MDNSGKEKEAIALMAEAEKRMKSSKSFFGALFGWVCHCLAFFFCQAKGQLSGKLAEPSSKHHIEKAAELKHILNINTTLGYFVLNDEETF